MNINFLLLLKKKYESILKKLNEIKEEYNEIILETDEIKEEYNEIILETDENENLKHQTDFNINLYHCNSEINKMNSILININKKIQHDCNHEFVYDYIDITPDLSKQIKYCTICEYTYD